MPRLTNKESATLEEFGFEFGAPPERHITRRSKHHERWEAAKTLCQKYPGQSLKVIEFTNASSAYQNAKQINNGEHKSFPGNDGTWAAVAAMLGEHADEGYGIWLTYQGDDE